MIGTGDSVLVWARGDLHLREGMALQPADNRGEVLVHFPNYGQFMVPRTDLRRTNP